ncbi:Uncharacterised protein [Mycobacteroides abscessus subsp. abscessus]|nr:Uncharacterised protein [Mycobacteroides abscessus subsp. abscessus]SIC92404.1 Uncharacterised protein [Mycobacteroides abscessus subsp. abscessus]SID12105.1 Uncharacterised protein [Mycobacteroides abscessus subsp. abscessus]SID16993.1 Uncharacterised protein [Mycobacteroides abscessus subsp. abscessus]SKV99444.1 Uncharacterised protein [Mycobacteroides abscessus subsp. abscessus]
MSCGVHYMYDMYHAAGCVGGGSYGAAMKLRLVGQPGPARAVITVLAYRGQRYMNTSRLLYAGRIDGMPCRDRLADETIVATVCDRVDVYELRPS